MNNRVFFLIALLILLAGNLGISALRADQYELVRRVYFDDNSDYEHPATVSALRDGYLVVGKQRMLFYDREGNPVWEKPLFSYNAVSDARGDAILVADEKSGDVYILNSKGELLSSHRGTGRVKRVKVFDEGGAGVLTADNTIYVYSPRLGKMHPIELPLGTIIDFDYSEDNKRLVAVLIDRALNSYLSVCAFSGEITSGIILEKQLVYGVKAGKQQIQVVSDASLAVYDYAGNLIEQTGDIGHVSRFDFDHGAVGSRDGQREELLVGDSRVLLPEDVSHARVIGSDILVALSDRIRIIDRNGRVLREIRGTEELIEVHSIAPESIVAEYSNRIEFYTLRK